MGNYRTTTLLAAKDVGAAATEVIDINVKAPISRINIYWDTKIVTVSVELAALMECISKIELVDGSDVLFSMTGEEAFALNYYDRGNLQDYEASLKVNDRTKVTFSLDFGRYLWDSMWALDPNKFKNLQLKITHSEALANTSVVVNELIVEALVFDEKPATPKGFFMSKEIFSYIPSASASEFIDLPTDHVIRKLMIQSDSTDKNPFEVIDQIKLSEDNDKKIVFDQDGEEFFRTWKTMWPRIEYKMVLDEVVTAKTIFGVPAYDVAIDVKFDSSAIGASGALALATVTNNKIALTASVDVQSETAEVSGYLPLSCMCYPFGIQEDDTDWYDAPRVGSLQLINKSASAVGGTPQFQVVLQQARMY